ncbi:type I restriction enzyme M protein [Abditibacterium utsteinense]|uniref:Type I restriction enzyme M protein n=1 Tax=Abditibacterium utsteinense TaxID=1960156 RepID=A0A2S8SWG1_9BACT|nr:N-6 DNA methylase [Abditibacterium utsteinense]PQV65133.1 type I restriction enzyme M protein [Abditibacterium utsteinense]
MNWIQEGIKKKHIRLEEPFVTTDGKDDFKTIVYVHQNKRRNYRNPEEKVQAETFLRLVFDYNYPAQRIRQFVAVQMGSDTKEADIIVYNDDACTSPHILIECKSPDVSEAEFKKSAEQAFSYAVPQGAKYVWTAMGIKNEYFERDLKRPQRKITAPDIPQFGVSGLAPFKYAYEGGIAKGGQKLFPLEKVGQDELTRRFKQAHQALWGGGELNPSEAFDELDKLIFCKLWDERQLRKPGEPYDFQIWTEEDNDETNRRLLERLKTLYEIGRKEDKEVFKDDIRLNATKARTVVGYLEDINLSETDLDSKGRAFETFMGSFFRGDFGQYFTPRPIVQFIVDVLPIEHKSRVLDTSCGSGGFLLHALDKVRKQAESHFGIGTAKSYKLWHDFAKDKLFGIEINEQIARTAKMNMIIHDDGHTNVVTADGLLPSDELRQRVNNFGFENGTFDFIITNPPFGSTVKQTEKAYMSQYRLAAREVDWLNPKSVQAARPNQDTEILFLEQCHKFLAEGGILAMVIPDSILTNSSLQYVRDNLEELYRILAVVSMPQTAFTATGAGVKSSVLFLKKYSESQTHKIGALKQSLKDTIRSEEKLVETLNRIERDKKETLKSLHGFTDMEVETRTLAELKASPEYLAWAKVVSETASAQAEALRYRLSEIYEAKRRQALTDYPIFMAIAEEIGYDATGKPTPNKPNDFKMITPELARFIEEVGEGGI